MATHDYVLANASGAAFRADLNNALAAIVSNNSNATEPATTYAYMWWMDTTSGQLKQRNAANDGWITIREIDGTMLMEDGTVSAPGLAFASDLDTGFFRPGANQLAVATNGIQRINIEADGDINIDSGGVFYDATNNRLAIGTTSPAATLHSRTDNAGSGSTPLLIQNRSISANTAVGISFAPNTSDTADRSAIIYGVNSSGGSGNATDLTFHTNASGASPTERARIDSSGRLLVGTSSARSTGGTIVPILQVEGTSNSNSALALVQNNSNATLGSSLTLAKTRAVSNGGVTVVQSGENLGSIYFDGADGTSLISAARISAAVDGTPGANDMPGRLVFSTTADGASSPTERMRITSGGRFAFGGQGAPYSSATCDSYNNTSGECAHAFRQDHVSGFGLGVGVDGTYLAYFYPNKDLSGAPVGSISQNGSATAYNTSSDYRLKENISLLPNAIVRLLELKPSRFNFISHPDRTVDGFIAHEVQAIVPEAINGEKDAVDDDGNPVYQGIDQSKLVPLLTAALQEAIGRIETLEAEVTALKAQ